MNRRSPQHPAALTALGVAAVQMHELFVEYQRAGFTTTQAMQLVATILSASIAVEAHKNQGGPA